MKAQIQEMENYNNEFIEHLKNSKMSLIKQGIMTNVTQTVMFPETQSRFNKIKEDDSGVDKMGEETIKFPVINNQTFKLGSSKTPSNNRLNVTSTSRIQ